MPHVHLNEEQARTKGEPSVSESQDDREVNFSYVIDKVRAANFTEQPFRHIEVNDLFEDSDFQRIISSPDILIEEAGDDKALFDHLLARSYQIIQFPGCTTDYKEYINWHKEKRSIQKTNTACEGFGVVLRLQSPQSAIIKNLQRFLNSPEFIECIAEKYGINPGDCYYDTGIQKYLDGYEISPHPDTRAKALTFMVNINPSPASADAKHHTSYLKFKPKWNYVGEFWKANEAHDRCWVPWDWCDVKKEQRRNNSMVIFSPEYDTLHAVKADYNHLQYQRTQLYGNLFYKHVPVWKKVRWEEFVIEPAEQLQQFNGLKGFPKRAKSAIKNMISGRFRPASTAK